MKRVRSEVRGTNSSGFKNTKLEGLCVRTTLLIHHDRRPHQPQLVGSVLGIGKQTPQLTSTILGISQQSTTTSKYRIWSESEDVRQGTRRVMGYRLP